MKYSESKIIDFLQNENTNVTWNQFAEMLYDKFGNEIESLIGHACTLTGNDFLSKEGTENLKNAKKYLNKVF